MTAMLISLRAATRIPTFYHKHIHFTQNRRMSASDIITAYSVAVPDKQQQNLPGLDKHITREPPLTYIFTTINSTQSRS